MGAEMTVMRAVSQDVAGGPEVLKLVEAPRPTPGAVEILVKVHAAGVNPTDWKTRERGRFNAGAEPPFVLGFDVAGVVEEVGAGVTLFHPGDEVYGMPLFPHPAGAYAEYLVTPTRHCAPKPRNLDFVQAAAVPLAALTAWQALVDTAKLDAGQRVLIHGAGGGVGHLAVQIAKARGAHVIGTASAGKHALLAELGANELIDYQTEDFGRLRDLDVVLDTVGGDYGQKYGTRSLRTLRPGGSYVSLRGFDEDFPEDEARAKGISYGHLLVEPDHAGLLALTELIETGRLRPIVDRVFPLEEAAAAHVYGESSHNTGKIVLSVAG
jgi:NADPH:quinone reductase-like Zn-dependent oxidoreductase